MTVKESLTKREQLLDEYETSLGLQYRSLFQADDELQSYFVMDRSQIEKLSPRDCSVMSYRLTQYAFQMQRCLNRERAIIPYAERELNQIVSNHSKDFSQYTKYDVKVAMVCAENNAAKEWQQIIVWATQRAIRLEELAKCINNLAFRISMVKKQNEEKYD